MNIEIAKKMLPDCKVGEVVEMTIEKEEGDNFVLSPYEKESEAPAKRAAPPKKATKGKRPRAVAKVLAEDY